MKRTEKYFIVGYDSLVMSMMSLAGFQPAKALAEADIVIFTGGADVTPGFYGHAAHPTTGAAPHRDVNEIKTYQMTRNDQLKVGICRGAQLLCVLNGGTLYQDVDRHALWETHECSYVDEKGQISTHPVTSTHHQMQNPYEGQDHDDLMFELWGFAERCTYRDREKREQSELGTESHPDVEIVFWPETNSLGFQGHPEYESKACRKLFFTCLDRALERKQ